MADFEMEDYLFNVTDSDSYYTDMWAEKEGEGVGVRMLVTLGVAALVTLVSVVCNGLVLGVVVRRPRLHNFPYIIIACIAIIDILNSFWEIWNIIMVDGNFIFTPICCKLITFLPYFLSMVVPLCLTALAVVRWRAKKSLQFGEERDVKKSVFVVLFICLLSAIIFYPVLHFTSAFEYRSKMSCVIDIPILKGQHIYDSVLFLFKYAFCSVVVVTSLVMAKRGRQKEVLEVDEEGEVVEKKEQLDKRFEIMIIIVWIIFMLFGAVLEMMPQFLDYTSFEVAKIPLTYLPLLYKFFLYKGMDQNFRKEFNALFTRAM